MQAVIGSRVIVKRFSLLHCICASPPDLQFISGCSRELFAMVLLAGVCSSSSIPGFRVALTAGAIGAASAAADGIDVSSVGKVVT